MARGRIKEGDDIIAQDIEIALTMKSGSDSLTEWYGSFNLPARTHIDPGSYRLELADGRAGEIIVVKVVGSFARFQGSGELK